MRDYEFKSVIEQLMIAGKVDIVKYLIERDSKQRQEIERLKDKLLELISKSGSNIRFLCSQMLQYTSIHASLLAVPTLKRINRNDMDKS